jgi:putative pyruvate formate lyase activating enzyme
MGVDGLRARGRALAALQSPCVLCPRECGAARARDDVGFCGIGATARVASWGLHFGEEAALVGHGGSGTVFLAGCSLGCVFCQNHTISHHREGELAGVDQLAAMMIELQTQGAENINWVTPTHVVPQLVSALARAVDEGLSIPVVYNCGGYESLEVLALLDGIVDIYLPDAKFADRSVAAELCGAPDYFARACRAIRLMHRQVGPLRLSDRGVATSGVLVRHLVMPNGCAGSAAWGRALYHITDGTGVVNVMGQYRPEFRAERVRCIARRPTHSEINDARGQIGAWVHLVD